MGSLEVRRLQEIVDDAIREISNPLDYSFSDYVNTIERKAHEIYLQEEKQAIKQILIKKFKTDSVLGNILEDLTEFIQKLSTIIANTRRSRGGGSSEYILKEALFRYAGINSEIIGRQRGNKSYYPDLAIPSGKDLIQNPSKAVALAVKRTLRERWREDITIFKHFPNSAFVCISENTDISTRKLKDMEKEGIGVLFLPDGKYKSLQLFIKNKVKRMKIYPLSSLPDWIRNIIP